MFPPTPSKTFQPPYHPFSGKTQLMIRLKQRRRPPGAHPPTPTVFRGAARSGSLWNGTQGSGRGLVGSGWFGDFLGVWGSGRCFECFTAKTAPGNAAIQHSRGLLSQSGHCLRCRPNPLRIHSGACISEPFFRACDRS